MRFADVIKNANANLMSAPIRTALTVLAIFIGAFTLSLTTGAGAGMSEFLDSQVSSIGGKNAMTVMAKNEEMGAMMRDPNKPQEYQDRKSAPRNLGGLMRSVMDDKDLERLKKVEGVLDAEPIKSVQIAFVGNGAKKFTCQARLEDEDAKPNLEFGKTPDNKASDFQIEVPPKFGEVLGFGSDSASIGQTVQVGVMDPMNGETQNVDAKIVGVSKRNFLGFQLASINKPLQDKAYDIQRAALPDELKNRYFVVKAHYDPKLSDFQVDKLKGKLLEEGFVAQTLKDQLGAIHQFLNAITAVFSVFAIIALVAAAFGVINTQLMSVQERTKEIGLMKAMGMSSAKVFSLFSFEAISLGFWGSFLGCGAGMIVGNLMNVLSHGEPMKTPPELSIFYFPLGNVAVIMGSIMFITFLAGALPSMRAASLDPITALRYE